MVHFVHRGDGCGKRAIVALTMQRTSRLILHLMLDLPRSELGLIDSDLRQRRRVADDGTYPYYGRPMSTRVRKYSAKAHTT